MSDHVDVSVNFGLTGEANFVFRVTQHFQAEQWIDPLVHFFHKAFFAAAFTALFHNHVATAAGAHPHAIHNLVGTFVQLHSVLPGDGTDVLTIRCFSSDLLIDEINRWHSNNPEEPSVRKEV